MKQGLIGGYLAIAFVFSIFMWLFGEHSYRGYPYNMGKAIVWPISIFKSYPEIDGDSPLKFASSYQKVASSGDMEGNVAFNEAIGLLAYYFYVEGEPSIRLKDFKELMYQGAGADRFFRSLIEKENIRIQMADYLDGMSFGDIVSERDDIEDDLMDLLEDRE